MSTSSRAQPRSTGPLEPGRSARATRFGRRGVATVLAIAAALAAQAPARASAQSNDADEARPAPVKIELYLFGGWRHSPRGELESEAARAGYLLDSIAPAFGVVVAPYLGNLRIPLRFERSWRRFGSKEHELLLTDAHFGAGLGYDLRLLDPLSIGPVAALDYVSSQADYDRARPAFAALQIGDGPDKRVELTKRSMALELGVALHTRIWGGFERGTRDKRVRPGLLLTTQIGYRQDLSQSDWYDGDNALGSAPSIESSGVFFRFGVGFTTSEPR